MRANVTGSRPTFRKPGFHKGGKQWNPEKRNFNFKKAPGRYFDKNKPFQKHKQFTPKPPNKAFLPTNKKIIFDDEGEVSKTITAPKKTPRYLEEARREVYPAEEGSVAVNAAPEVEEDGIKWYQHYAQYNTNADLVELKENELNALTSACKLSFESELPHFIKKNPSDAKWLQTALHKGTAKDQVNSGALLVHTNPLANLDSLEILIGLCKVSNRASTEGLFVISELFMEVLIPADRKLLSLSLRGADWKALRSNESIPKETKSKIYAFWHFEAALKELYFEFLKNVQQCLQTGQDPVKNAGIVCVSKLLCHGPEKEQLLLSMLVNKLGDPSNKTAAKALHHLSVVVFKHPNMCGVITNETEKLLFRNNISEQAQHFALCFLSRIAPNGNPDVCTKLVNICFAFFKVLVQRGAVNNKTMQSILRCLQKAIVEAKPVAGSAEIMNKEMQDTIYRLVHLADIQISIQTLSLLLQLISAKGENPDRFYNALYKKMTDLRIGGIGARCASQFFHVIHRAVHLDMNIPRAMAFIKRLLQISMYMPPHMTIGCIIVANKILKVRPELRKIDPLVQLDELPAKVDTDLSRFDDEEDEKYEDVLSDSEAEKKTKGEKEKVEASWHHLKLKNEDSKKEGVQIKDVAETGYDPYHRVAAYAGAQFINRFELTLLQRHFHPTCQVFADLIIAAKGINYYGDPLRDFTLTHFLERFSFKNPKRLNNQDGTKSPYGKSYVPQGGRAQSVHSLTKDNCPEEELFIFNYLEKKRERQVVEKKDKTEDEDVESVDDDEFESYLDSLCKTDATLDDGDDDMDFYKEMNETLKKGDSKPGKKKQKSSKADEEDDDSDVEMDDFSGGEEGSISEDEDGEAVGSDGEAIGSDDEDDEGSISLDEADSQQSDEGDDFGKEDSDEDGDSDAGDSEDEEDASMSEDDDYEPSQKKSKGALKTDKQFTKTLKRSSDMSSLFAAADDFAELLEETGKDKQHGTSNAIFNKDKSSAKQLKWEEKRRQNISGKPRFNNKKFGRGGRQSNFRRK